MSTITSLSPASGPVTGGASVTITGTGFSNVGPLTVRFGTTATTFTIDSATQITAIAPAGAVGTVQVTVQALLDGISNPLPYTYLPVPALNSVSPGRGATAGGTVVTLTGSGLTGVTAVSFGATPAASFTVNSDAQITAVTPPGTGIVSVTVTGPGGTSNAVNYVYVAVPTITSISPISGPTAGGDTVAIIGTGFTGPLTVQFGTTATIFTVNSATQITAVAPAGSPGTVQITVIGSGGASNGISYTYAAVPTLSATAPGSGTVAGGTTVVLTGTGFVTGATVSFGGTPATSVTVDSTTQITTVTPMGSPGVVEVIVTTVGGTTGGIPYVYV
ncbi:IPT/TIG domain-containing protein [Nocardia sp. NPDC046763]|uniref:IPT/TIG domain-containing protein n=1 Tax=Nocardia sp. NPDC046763 TaxID=3155256 RepID=UPI0033C64C5B